jgi:uncharacterized protein (TIGR02246 family)
MLNDYSTKTHPIMRRPATLMAALLIATACQHRAPTAFSESDDRAIRQVLAEQQAAWNAFDLTGFMKGYWKSDSLKFVGSKITTGWQATLNRYRQSYPDPNAMGQLTFTIISVTPMSHQLAVVTGRYTLVRSADTPTGLFTLLFQKINNHWVIVYDHTS